MNNKIIRLKRFTKSICQRERNVAILLALTLVLSLGIMALPMAGTVWAQSPSDRDVSILVDYQEGKVILSSEALNTIVKSKTNGPISRLTGIKSNFYIQQLHFWVEDNTFAQAPDGFYLTHNLTGGYSNWSKDTWHGLLSEDGTYAQAYGDPIWPAGMTGVNEAEFRWTMHFPNTGSDFTFYIGVIGHTSDPTGTPPDAGTGIGMDYVFGLKYTVATGKWTVVTVSPYDANRFPITPLMETFVGPDEYFTNIQNGIDAVAAGGTVHVAAGNYDIAAMGGSHYEPVSINKSLSLIGDGSASTILDATGFSGHCDVISVQASGVTIEGFTVTGGDFGVRISSSTAQEDINFNDLVVTENHGSGFVFDNLYGNQSVSDVTFLNCQANYNGNRGIYFAPNKAASDISLTNTDCNNNQIMGFNCQGTMDNLIIDGGTFNGNLGGNPSGTSEGPYYGFGISLGNCTNTTIRNVTVQGNGISGPEEGGAGIIVKGNSDGVTIEGATLHENQNGLWVEDPWTVENTTGPFAQNVSIHLSNIKDNIDFGVRNYINPTTVDATQNWWGDASGPYHATSNTDGTGDAVSDNVVYFPWFINSDKTTLVKYVTITKTGPATANKGENITYTITYKNISTSVDATNVVITETYPAEVEFVSSDPAPDTNTTNQWTIDTLEAGTEDTIEITVKIK